METEEKKADPPSKKRNFIGAMEVVAGIANIGYLVMSKVWPRVWVGFGWLDAALAVAAVLYILAGVGVLKRMRGALALSLILQLAALVDLQTSGGFIYIWDPGLDATFAEYSCAFYRGIDILAAVMIYLILSLMWKERKFRSDARHTCHEPPPRTL